MRSYRNYSRLGDYLRNSGKQSVTLTFQEIEKIIGCDLPASARDHNAWWDNCMTENAHTQARLGWLGVGYKVTNLDRHKETVTFIK